MPKFYHQTDALVWVQPDGINTVCEMLDCHDIADVVVPKGDVERSYCIDPATGKFVPGARRQGPPGMPTTSLTAHVGLNKDWLEQIQNCPTTIYVHKAPCGDRRNFLNYERSYTLRYAIFTQQTLSNLAMLMSTTGAPGESTQAFDVNIDVKKDTFKLDMTPLVTTEAEAALDIAFCNTEQCAGYCGPAIAECTSAVVVYAAGAGVAAVEYTNDRGATWEVASGAGPFDAEEDLVSVVCFAVGDGATTRWVVARAPDAAAGEPAEIAWSDDSGTTWNVVSIGSSNTEGGAWGGALFALDHRHIWFVTNEGNIFFSADGSLSWTEQGVGVTGEVLNYVRFVDYNFGMAVGANNTVLITSDGGRHWNSVNGPTGGDNLLCCTIFDGRRAWVADDTGSLFYTDLLAINMAATDWAERLLDTPTGAVSTNRINDIMFVRESGFQTDDHCGYLVTKWTGAESALHGAIYRTINGGYDWEIWYTAQMDVGATGLNAVWACGQNQAYAVGSPIDSVATIIEVNGALV